LARVILEIEDQKNGTVSVKCTPSYETIRKLELSGEITAAHAYTVKLLSEALKISKQLNENYGENNPGKLWIPPR
jgi:hypothetical protein